MLSKIELDFLELPESFDANYSRVLRHRIQVKTERLRRQIRLLEANGFVITENRNGIRESYNIEKTVNRVAFGELASAGGGIRTHVGLRQRILSRALIIDYRDLRADFVVWLKSRGINWDHYAKCLIRNLDKFSQPICEPMDVVAMFTGLQNDSQRRHLVNGLRNLFNFCQAQGLADKQWLDLLRGNLPRTSVGIDLKVPEESEIIQALRRIREMNPNPRYFALYNLLLDSGLRVTEAIRLINGLISQTVQLEPQKGYSIASLGYFRGTKLAYYGFISDFSLRLIEECEKPLTYKKIIGTASKRFKVVSYKYLRKFAFDMMTSEQLNIPESVADFIKGRTPKSVGARHYMLLKRKAVQFYPRYSGYLAQVRARAFGIKLSPETPS